MKKTENLRKARVAKNDEFYTRLEDIEKELGDPAHGYIPYFFGKTVYCNSDVPGTSAFWRFFMNHFAEYGLKKLYATHFSPLSSSTLYTYDGRVVTETPLSWNGSFDSPECLDILDKSDIIVTNPPFSQWRRFIRTLIERKKQFAVLGPLNAVTYREVFPLLQSNQVRLGFNRKRITFEIPQADGKAETVETEEGTVLQTLNNIRWYTTFDINLHHDFLPLKETYEKNKKRHPKYENYNAIECRTLKEIPCDFDGIIGVPITLFELLCHEQFEVIGIACGWTGKVMGAEWKDNVGYVNARTKHGANGYGIIDGKQVYHRVLIKKKTNFQENT